MVKKDSKEFVPFHVGREDSSLMTHVPLSEPLFLCYTILREVLKQEQREYLGISAFLLLLHHTFDAFLNFGLVKINDTENLRRIRSLSLSRQSKKLYKFCDELNFSQYPQECETLLLMCDLRDCFAHYDFGWHNRDHAPKIVLDVLNHFEVHNDNLPRGSWLDALHEADVAGRFQQAVASFIRRLGDEHGNYYDGYPNHPHLGLVPYCHFVRSNFSSHFTFQKKEIVQALDRLAEATGLSRDWHVNRALENYLELQAWQIEQIKEGIAAADRGEFASDEDIKAIKAKYGLE